MLQFIRFKSNSFISLNSACLYNRLNQRGAFSMQSHVDEYDDDTDGDSTFTKVFSWIHQECKDGKYTLPAYVISDERQEWLKNGEPHRDERDENGRVLPAVITSDGGRHWYRNGKKHRDDRDENGRVLPADIWSDGSQEWMINGNKHRDDKDENGFTLPAGIYSKGIKAWWKNGKLHRDDRDENSRLLPAIIYINEFPQRQEYWINGSRIFKNEI